MSVKATCEACCKGEQDCFKIGEHFVCVRCQGIYNDVRTFVIDETGRILSYPGARAKEMVDDAVAKFSQARNLMRCAEYADADLDKAVVALPPGTLAAYLDRTERIVHEGDE